jgi:hypothetical protein
MELMFGGCLGGLGYPGEADAWDFGMFISIVL